MMRLELFFKDKARCESRRNISPHLSPQRGHPMISDRPLFTSILSWFACFAASPTSVGFMARAALDVFKPRSPKTSLIAHAKTSSRTDGLDDLRTGFVLYETRPVKTSLRPVLTRGRNAKMDELAPAETCELLLISWNPPHPDTLSAEPSESQNVPRLCRG